MKDFEYIQFGDERIKLEIPDFDEEPDDDAHFNLFEPIKRPLTMDETIEKYGFGPE